MFCFFHAQSFFLFLHPFLPMITVQDFFGGPSWHALVAVFHLHIWPGNPVIIFFLQFFFVFLFETHYFGQGTAGAFVGVRRGGGTTNGGLGRGQRNENEGHKRSKHLHRECCLVFVIYFFARGVRLSLETLLLAVYAVVRVTYNTWDNWFPTC